MSKSPISKRTQEALNEAGNYELKRGKKHIKIYIRGYMVGILPACIKGDGQKTGNAERNVIAQIKKASQTA